MRDYEKRIDVSKARLPPEVLLGRISDLDPFSSGLFEAE